MTTAAEHLAELDRTAPGLVVGAHVVGSGALDDLVPGSDLDLVCELSTDPDVAVLAAALRPDLDVIYLRHGQLDLPVAEASALAWGRDGDLHRGGADLTPVLWEQLRGYARTERGRRPRPPVTADEVADWCRHNLVHYWQPLLDRAEAAFAQPGRDADRRVAVLWLAPGPARHRHTITTGGIVGKSQALELAGRRWPELAAPLAEIAKARRDGVHPLGPEHAAATLELGRRVRAEVLSD